MLALSSRTPSRPSPPRSLALVEQILGFVVASLGSGDAGQPLQGRRQRSCCISALLGSAAARVSLIRSEAQMKRVGPAQLFPGHRGIAQRIERQRQIALCGHRRGRRPPAPSLRARRKKASASPSLSNRRVTWPSLSRASPGRASPECPQGFQPSVPSTIWSAPLKPWLGLCGLVAT